jgi:hypothetical protein
MWALAVVPVGIEQPGAQVLQVGPSGYLIPNYFGTTPNWAFSPVPTVVTPMGNPLIDRAYATDNAAEVFVVLPTPLPSGQVQSIQTLNQAAAGGSFQPSAGLSFHAYILRPTVNPNEYTVVFDSGLLTVPPLADPAVSEIAIFPANVPVQANDVLAFYGQGVPLDIGAGTDILSFPAPAAPPQGSVIALGSAEFPLLPTTAPIPWQPPSSFHSCWNS